MLYQDITADGRAMGRRHNWNAPGNLSGRRVLIPDDLVEETSCLGWEGTLWRASDPVRSRRGSPSSNVLHGNSGQNMRSRIGRACDSHRWMNKSAPNRGRKDIALSVSARDGNDWQLGREASDRMIRYVGVALFRLLRVRQ
ncbi:hypothetical protein BD414DRAFT_481779 [Trametes punicea]|nr:hypothetical protein BD414DRAFT_481779 [Trametes punicea]